MTFIYDTCVLVCRCSKQEGVLTAAGASSWCTAKSFTRLMAASLTSMLEDSGSAWLTLSWGDCHRPVSPASCTAPPEQPFWSSVTTSVPLKMSSTLTATQFFSAPFITSTSQGSSIWLTGCAWSHFSRSWSTGESRSTTWICVAATDFRSWCRRYVWIRGMMISTAKAQAPQLRIFQLLRTSWKSLKAPGVQMFAEISGFDLRIPVTPPQPKWWLWCLWVLWLFPLFPCAWTACQTFIRWTLMKNA